MQRICLKSAWALLVVCLWPSVSCLDLANKTDDIIYDDSKIVGGLPANPKQFPFICRLLIGRGGQGRGMCAGSIISKRCLVTAAHCVSRRPSSVKTQCGFLDFKNPTGEEFEAEADMSTLLVHSQYGRNNRNDIALLCLPPGNEFPATEHIQAVRVTDRTEYPTGSVVTCGWGTTSEGGSVSSMLRYVEVPMHNPDTCSSTLGSGFEHSSMICAGDMEGGKDSCQGDSGGPLIDSVTKHLVGIVSWGFGCARPNQPGVYTRVGMYTDWIFNSIKNIEADA